MKNFKAMALGIVASILATASAMAGDFESSGSGNFSGEVYAFSSSAGIAATAGLANTNGFSSVSNESGGQQFSGAAVSYDFDGGFAGRIEMTADTLSTGSDFSNTTTESWGTGSVGAGGGFGIRSGYADASGSFEGEFDSNPAQGNGGGCHFFCF